MSEEGLVKLTNSNEECAGMCYSSAYKYNFVMLSYIFEYNHFISSSISLNFY